MTADLFYKSLPGRMLFIFLQRAGFFRLAAWFLHTRMSKHLIHGYIRKHGIDMPHCDGQSYRSFAEFFSRKREKSDFAADPNVLISPCDGLLSVYTVTDGLEIPMKGSVYTLSDLVTCPETAELFRGGLCLVFRLEVSDYHHFCCIDDGRLIKTTYIPGELHSVQPIALRSVPVFRLNRRWWSIMETKHFGMAVQIEVGAVLVGGVSLCVKDAGFNRGDEMGHFELAGSTIILLLDSSVRKRLRFTESYASLHGSGKEARVRTGVRIGDLTDEK